MLCILLIAGSPSYILGHTRKRRLRSLLVLQRMLQKLELQVASFSSSKSMFCVTQHKQQTSAHEENRKKMFRHGFQMFPDVSKQPILRSSRGRNQPQAQYGRPGAQTNRIIQLLVPIAIFQHQIADSCEPLITLHNLSQPFCIFNDL